MSEAFAGFRLQQIEGVPVLWRGDRRFKSFRCVLAFRRPLDHRAAARSLLPSLMLQGTERDPDRPALARRMESLYGAAVIPGCRKVGESQLFRLSLDAVSGRYLPEHPDQLGEGFRFLSDYLGRPRLDGAGFPAEVFERERQQAVNAVRTQVDDKTTWARREAVRMACEGEPMAIPDDGGLEALESLERQHPEEVRQDFVRHGEAFVLAMGAVDEPELLAAVRGLLEQLPQREPEAVPPAVQVAQREPRRHVEYQSLKQSKLVLLHRIPPPPDVETWVGRRLFFSLLGGGAHSRLFREVREKRSLAYYASASVERNKGLAVIQVGLDHAQAEAAEAAIREQIDELRAGSFDDSELETARAGILSGLRAVSDSVQDRLAFTAEQWLHQSDRDPEQQAELYAAAGRDQVLRGAEGLWDDFTYLLSGEQDA